MLLSYVHTQMGFLHSLILSKIHSKASQGLPINDLTLDPLCKHANCRMGVLVRDIHSLAPTLGHFSSSSIRAMHFKPRETIPEKGWASSFPESYSLKIFVLQQQQTWGQQRSGGVDPDIHFQRDWGHLEPFFCSGYHSGMDEMWDIFQGTTCIPKVYKWFVLWEMKQAQARDEGDFLLHWQEQSQPWGFQLAWWNITCVTVQKPFQPHWSRALWVMQCPKSASAPAFPEWVVQGLELDSLL